MTSVKVADAFDRAQFVRAKEIAGWQYVQVWYGGTTVRVFAVENQEDGSVEEQEPWSVSDDKGRPVDQLTIDEHMEQHFSLIEEGWYDE